MEQLEDGKLRAERLCEVIYLAQEGLITNTLFQPKEGIYKVKKARIIGWMPDAIEDLRHKYLLIQVH